MLHPLRRGLIALTLLGFLALASHLSRAQESPLYALAYPSDGQVSVAALLPNGEWRFTALPNTFFGQGDVALIAPLWSADGQTLYATARPSSEPPESEAWRAILRYDLPSDSAAEWLVMPSIGRDYEFLALERAPNGETLLATRWPTQFSYLINLGSGAVLYKTENCPFYPLFWSAEYLLTLDFLCPNTVRLIDPRSGKQLLERAIHDAEFYSFEPLGYQLVKGDLFGVRWLPNTTRQQLVRLSLSDLSTAPVTDARTENWLMLSADGSFGALNDGAYLKRLRLADGTRTEIGVVAMDEGAHTAGNAVIIWSHDLERARLWQHHITLESDDQHVIYEGAPFSQLFVPPQGTFAALRLPFGADDEQVAIYNNGKQVWSSAEAFQSGALQGARAAEKSLRSVARWQGAWLLLRVQFADGTQRDVAINAEDGRLFMPPQAAMRLVSASPDYVWWVVSNAYHQDEFTQDALWLYAPDSGRLVALPMEGILGERNFHWQPELYYRWSR